MRGPLAFDEHVTVYAPPINVLESHGSGDIMVQGGLRGEYLSLILSGSGDVVLEGKTGELTIENSGSGDIDISGLETRSVDVKNTGSGEVTGCQSM